MVMNMRQNGRQRQEEKFTERRDGRRQTEYRDSGRTPRRFRQRRQVVCIRMCVCMQMQCECYRDCIYDSRDDALYEERTRVNGG